jgi:hypothetical protein
VINGRKFLKVKFKTQGSTSSTSLTACLEMLLFVLSNVVCIDFTKTKDNKSIFEKTHLFRAQ